MPSNASTAPSAGSGGRAGSGAFTATVSAISHAFGDPTRRSIFLHAREVGHGVTAAQVAERFGLHPNVARHHLDKLAAGGYLEVAVERAVGSGAGRPSKHYRVVADGVPEVPVRTDDLVLTLLGKALEMLPPEQAEEMAQQVGHEYGVAIAVGLTGNDLAVGQRSLRSALQSVADALTAHGFAAHADQRSEQLRIVSNHCPFGQVAIDHPVLCAVDRGMVRGMLGALYGGDAERPVEVSQLHSLPQGDTFCATAV